MSTIRVFTEGERAEIKRSYENAADKKKQIGILRICMRVPDYQSRLPWG